MNSLLNMGNKFQCYQTHPPLVLPLKDKKAVIYGGSCISPAVNDADVYVSLDDKVGLFNWEAPWKRTLNQETREHIRFPIEDFFVPEDPEEFEQCLNYVVGKLEEGKKVHVGCAAGHGRTGLFLAALTQKIHLIHEEYKKQNPDVVLNEYAEYQPYEEEFNALKTVRKKYCSKAVETLAQALFLENYYNIKRPHSFDDISMKVDGVLKEELGMNIQEILNKGEFPTYAGFIDSIQTAIHKFERQQAEQKKVMKP